MNAKLNTYFTGVPKYTVIPFNLGKGSIVQNAIEKGINERLFMSGLLIELSNIAIIVRVKGPIKVIKDISCSSGFSYFLPNLFVFIRENSGYSTAEKNILPLLIKAMNSGRIVPHCIAVFLKYAPLLNPYLWVFHNLNVVETPLVFE